jgi:stage V sporulation protein R
MKQWNEGIELDVNYLEKVLPYIHQLWGRPVHMETVVEERPMLFSYDGKGIHSKDI